MSALVPTGPVLSSSDINTTINGEPRIQDLRLAEALGFEKIHNIRRLVSNHTKALEEFGNLVFSGAEKTSKGGRPGKEYWLTEKQALYLCTKSEAPNAIDITIEMVEVFHAVKTGTVPVKAHRRRKPVAKRTRSEFERLIDSVALRVSEAEYRNRKEHREIEELRYLIGELRLAANGTPTHGQRALQPASAERRVRAAK